MRVLFVIGGRVWYEILFIYVYNTNAIGIHSNSAGISLSLDMQMSVLKPVRGRRQSLGIESIHGFIYGVGAPITDLGYRVCIGHRWFIDRGTFGDNTQQPRRQEDHEMMMPMMVWWMLVTSSQPSWKMRSIKFRNGEI